MTTSDQSEKPPSTLTFVLIALGLAVVGVAMLGHGIGAINMDWFRPNPHAPAWVFAMIGAILLLAGFLSAVRAAKLPPKYGNPSFYFLLALSLVIAHWIVFFAEGATCSATTGNIILRFGGVICQTVAGTELILFDLIFLALAISAILQKKKKR